MKKTNMKIICMTFLLVAGVVAMVEESSAATYTLRADRVNLTMPDGAVVPAWGFADDVAGAGTGTVTVPGPQLIVPAGDTTLTINVTNNLPVPVSINIPGQRYPTGATPTMCEWQGTGAVLYQSGCGRRQRDDHLQQPQARCFSV